MLLDVGIAVNGDNPWDMQVHDERVYDRVLSDGSVGLGESYMEGWWDVPKLDVFFTKILAADLDKKVRAYLTPVVAWRFLRGRFLNLQRLRPFDVGKRHYDLGNDLYEAMLDSRLTYSCGYWKEARTLDEAQEAKLDLIARKLGLKEGESVLDIGSGWGSFLQFAAERYGIRGVGITVSKEQVEYANRKRGNLPIETRLEDYYHVSGSFDHLVSVGMLEHVGYKNYRAFIKKAYGLLKENGLFLLHSIGGNRSVSSTDPWLEKYIFPHSMLPSIQQIGAAIEGIFVMEDWHNFGAYYDTTLMRWFENFDANWDRLKERYDERFYRMWKYYLLSCAASFRARRNQLWQIVLSKNGVPGGYNSVR